MMACIILTKISFFSLQCEWGVTFHSMQCSFYKFRDPSLLWEHTKWFLVPNSSLRKGFFVDSKGFESFEHIPIFRVSETRSTCSWIITNFICLFEKFFNMVTIGLFLGVWETSIFIALCPAINKPTTVTQTWKSVHSIICITTDKHLDSM